MSGKHRCRRPRGVISRLKSSPSLRQVCSHTTHADFTAHRFQMAPSQMRIHLLHLLFHFISSGSSVMTDVGSSLSGFEYIIDKTWDGLPVDHDPIHVKMKWHFAKQRGKPHKRVIRVNFEAPLFDDPDPPPEPPGILNGLWEYEVVEFFFANNRNQYIEVEVGPHGHWLCLLFDGIRKPFNNGEELELEITNKFVGNVWHCEFEIPLAYLPGNITKFNSFAIHGSGNDRVYEALSPVTDGNFKEPDFHRLQFYERINMNRLLPEGYGSKPFIDYKYGDIWKDHY